MRLAIFLRAVNVGGRNKVPMADLRDALTAAGFGGVSSYIQSGNVIVDADDKTTPSAVASHVRKIIAESFGHDIDVIVRRPEELVAIIETGPFRDEDPKQVLVVLLEQAFDGELDASRFAPDVCVVSANGTEVHAFCPTGFSKSKLTAKWIETQAGCSGTGRNWNTMTKMASLAETVVE